MAGDPAKTELRPPEPVDTNDPRVEAFRLLVGIVDRLREPDGCPWDKEQTLESMTPHLVEEAHELAEAIETDQDESVVGEAGDLLLNVLLVARIAQDDDRFDLTHVCEAICAKLIRRHPHVFGDAEAEDSAQVLNRWEQIKKAERTVRGMRWWNRSPGTPDWLVAVKLCRPLDHLDKFFRCRSSYTKPHCTVGAGWEVVVDRDALHSPTQSAINDTEINDSPSCC